ncbi:MAG: single-stranded DNA-binding protein [Oscillospiraceae bacterium]|nr:single-stranded DNA-binding protein [Oscillospiraceae bacterium]
MMNQVDLIGRLAADPELRQTGSGVPVTSFTVAVDRPYTKGNDRQTDWIDIVAWRNTAEFVCKYFQKGSPIVINGSIQTRNWEDKQGIKRKSVEIVANSVEFVPRSAVTAYDGPQDSDSAQTYETAESFNQGSNEDFVTVDDEDLPF